MELNHQTMTLNRRRSIPDPGKVRAAGPHTARWVFLSGPREASHKFRNLPVNRKGSLAQSHGVREIEKKRERERDTKIPPLRAISQQHHPTHPGILIKDSLIIY